MNGKKGESENCGKFVFQFFLLLFEQACIKQTNRKIKSIRENLITQNIEGKLLKLKILAFNIYKS